MLLFIYLFLRVNVFQILEFWILNYFQTKKILNLSSQCLYDTIFLSDCCRHSTSIPNTNNTFMFTHYLRHYWSLLITPWCDVMPNQFQAIYCRKGVKLQLIKAKPGIHGLHLSLYTDTKNFHKTWYDRLTLTEKQAKNDLGTLGIWVAQGWQI